MSDFDQQTPPQKAFLYTGNALALLGLLLFLSTFFSAAVNFGDFSNFEEQTRSMSLRAVSGMFLMIVGGIIHGVARKKTYESDSSVSQGDLSGPVMIRCPSCKAINDEAAKFCDQCGQEL